MKKLLILLVGAMLLTGCSAKPLEDEVESTEPLVELTGPDQIDEEYTKDDINWSDAIEEAQGYFTEEFDDMTYSLEFTATSDPKTKQMSILAVVSDDTTAEAALEYANRILHEFNDFILYEQDNDLTLSSENSHGGIYKEYSVSIGVAAKSQKNDESKWFVKQEIPAGEYKELELQSK